MQTVYFIGIDLAFSAKNNSGVSILSAIQPNTGRRDTVLQGLTYIGSRLCKTDEEIGEFVLPYLIPGNCAVAVDAPLVVPNKTGMRPCERGIARVFGSRQCTAYPGHQGNMAGTRGPQLLSYLESLGVPIVANPRMEQHPDAVHFMETYPHAAHLAMFELPTVWKYKKKPGRSWDLCRSELIEYWRRIGALMPAVTSQMQRLSGLADTDPLLQRIAPWLRAIEGGILKSVQPPEIIGKRYKEFEDLTDGLFCAYMAGHIYAGKPALLFSPKSNGSTDLQQYKDGDDFIVVPSL
ncbi:DUF429 domain-containing protein [Alicyclobacillus sp. SO9]|uniref:DUF429 domain-containing protein n=1 Tax=Alicyclobacillus sp. SO9 TaxID=2665646 RepID=UPI0018E89C08|nr:DUF429 domain-containing protein [Alicyclobacillus sp. SO9]QQE80578.1 DUF429 domain-containing protein [Alicyclobacillus sp. SO9]